MREFIQLEADVVGDKFVTYCPYPWQREFHAAGKDNAERMLMAGNRVGKTAAGGFETAVHLTGEYPHWWEGARFEEPVLVWTGSPTNETSKDIVQRELLGGLGEKLGTGWIPKRLLVGNPTTRQAGVRNVIDSFQVQHKNGGISTCIMKTHEQGWAKWQGTAPHVIWLDEEPASDPKIFAEAQTRILTSHGILMLTFTPLNGQTEIVDHFLKGLKGSYFRGATWDDAPHLDPKKRAELIARYPDYQVDARTQGIPMLGEGAVFPVPDSQIRVDPFKLPDFWPRGKAIDFGINHPGAGVETAYDTTNDVIYVVDCYKKSGETAAYHAAWLNKSNRWIPVFWPHDGLNREKSGGKTLADHYRDHGVKMWSHSACYARLPGEEKETRGAQPVEPIVEEILERMATGRFKVFSNLTDWFEEKRSYHRKDGRLAIVRDDILKATFYCCLMRRRWVPATSAYQVHRPQPQNPIATSRI
jgi:phage terminase large subunit-like protein